MTGVLISVSPFASTWVSSMNCAKRAVNTRHGAAQHDEARAGGLGRRFEIHSGDHTGDLVVLARGEIERGNVAPAALFDIVGLIRAVRHVFGRAVWQPGEHIGQLRVKLACRRLHRTDLLFLDPHERAQAFEFGLVARGLGGADLAGGAVLVGLRGIGGGDLAPAGFVERQHLIGHRVQMPARQGGVEGIGVVADGADVVHGTCPRMAVEPSAPFYPKPCRR